MKSNKFLLPVFTFACLFLFVVPSSHALIMTQTFTGVITEGSGLGVGVGDTVYGSAVFNTDRIGYVAGPTPGPIVRYPDRVAAGWVGVFHVFDNNGISPPPPWLELHFNIGYASWEGRDVETPYADPAYAWGFYGTNTFSQIQWDSWPIPYGGEPEHWNLSVNGTDFYASCTLCGPGPPPAGEDWTTPHLAGVFNLPTHNQVPEPATMLLLGSGLVGLAGFGRKKIKK